jgi:outer membrane lipoprotein-sorting protein
MKLIAVLGLTAGLALPRPAPAQTADEIVARNIEARGGLAKLKAVQSLRKTGWMTVGPATEAPMVIEMKRPYRFRLDVTFQGKTLSSAYDGKNGWQLNPFEGGGGAEAMGPEDQSEAAEQADMDGSLVDWKQKGHSVELLGREKVGAIDAWKLKVTLKNGTVRTLYLSPETYLAIKAVTRHMVDGAESETEQMIGNYKMVSGILIPHSLEGGPTGSSERQKTTIEKIEINVPIDDGRFAMPARKTAPRPGSDDASRQGIGGNAN